MFLGKNCTYDTSNAEASMLKTHTGRNECLGRVVLEMLNVLFGLIFEFGVSWQVHDPTKN